MKKSRRIAVGVVLSVCAFVGWYSVAANYDYHALAGTYSYEGSTESCTLYLDAGGTYVQKVSRSGAVKESTGQWHRYGESHVSFSREFLKLEGQELNAEGQAHGQFEKQLGIFPRLVLAPIPNGPIFRRKLFHR